MAKPDAPVTVTLDAEAAKRADEALGAEIDAEVKRRIDQERNTLDTAQMQAAIDAANKNASAATARADAAEKAAVSAQAAAEKIAADFKARADASATADASETLTRARFLAEHRGHKGDAMEVEAKRLAGFGRAAVDELLMVTPAPSADPMGLQLRPSYAPAGGVEAPKILVTPDADGKTVSYTINEPALTVPGWKAPVSLGVRQ